MSPLRGYKALGKARGERYLTPDGREISKRQYRNIVAKRSGWKSLSHKERATQKWAARTPIDRAHAEQFKERRDRYAERQKLSKAQASRALAALYDEAESESWDRSSDGALARILALAGLRPEDADYNVGDTP